MEEPAHHIAKAINAVRAITDPEQRFQAAATLEKKLVEARTAALDLKRGALVELRSPDFGYKRIADSLGLTKSRIAQITQTPPVVRIYAVQDQEGHWHPTGAENLLTEDQYEEGTIHFRPVDTVKSPLAGQDLRARFGPVDREWSMYTCHVALAGDVERVVGTTHEVHEALFADNG